MSKIRKIKQKNIKSKLRNSIIAILIVLTIVSIWLIPPMLKLIEARGENARLKKELVACEKSNKDLKKLIANLKTDEYIEVEERKQSGYIKQGEVAYTVIQKRTKEKEKKQVEEPNLWEKTVTYFKGIF